jgi:thioredoxin 1
MRCGGEHAAYIIPRAAASAVPSVFLLGSDGPQNQKRERSGEFMASENVHVFNDMNFENEVLQSGETVLVDFTAAWCGPCKRLAPIVEEVAEATKGKVKVGKLDIDEAPITASKLGIRSVPTLIVFKDGKAAGQHLGLTTKAKILDLVGA